VKLIIGLGNPGIKYDFTRHNMGFLVLNELAGRAGISLTGRKFDSHVGRGTVAGSAVILAKPQLFMNLSGIASGKLVRFFRIDISDVIIVHDDLDFPWGVLRIKVGGGDGGHKGLRSIINHLGSHDFVRIRLGIGQPAPGCSAENYVLERFSEQEVKQLPGIIETACTVITEVIASGTQTAMNKCNVRVTKNLKQEV
jgi:PTH1 family peptidyl-tRNA hydrolase